MVVRWNTPAVPRELPRMASLGVDLRIVLFTATGSIAIAAAAALVSVVAARRAAERSQIAASLSKSRRGATGISPQLLIAVQTAVGFVLLSGAFLFARNLLQLLELNLGFEMEGVYSARFDSRLTRFGSQARCNAFFGELLEELRSRPGIEAAALTELLPLGSWQMYSGIRMEGVAGFEPGESLRVVKFGISEGYFKTIGIPLIEGTDFDVVAQEHGCIINRALQERVWPAGNALGQVFQPDSDPCTVFGVAENTKRADIRLEPSNELYRHYSARAASFPPIVVFESHLGAESAARQLVDIVRMLAPFLPPPLIAPLEDQYKRQVASERFYTLIVSLFALCTLLQGGSSLFALAAFAVRARVREMGIRLALGARPAQLVRQITLSVLPFSLAGLVLGGTVYVSLSRLLQSFLFRLSPTDPLSLFSATLGLIAVSLAASWIPARWAAQVDPSRTLRIE